MQIIDITDGIVEINITYEDVPIESLFDEDYLYNKVKNFVLTEVGCVIADKEQIKEHVILDLGSESSWTFRCPFKELEV